MSDDGRVRRHQPRVDEIRCRPACAAQGRSDAVARPGALHRRHQPAGPGLCRHGAQPDRAREAEGHRRRGCARHAGRAGCSHTCRSRSGGLRAAQVRDEHPAARRLADEDAAQALPRQGPRALRRRSGGLRRGRDGRSGQGRRRSRRARHRGAACRHHAGRCAEGRGAAAPCRRAGQPRPRLPLRRCRSGEEGLRRGRPRHPARDRFQPHHRQSHGAALGDRRLRSQDRALHPACRLPGRDGPARRPGQGRAEPATRQGARADRQCRRLVRHEVPGLSGIRPAAARLEAAGPAGEMDRRTLRELFERPSRPRSPAHRRAGARQGGPLPRRAAHRHRQCRRLHLSADARDHQRGEECHRRLQDAGDGSEFQGRLHQHHADRRLSRRRPARGQLLYGAADRHRGARNGHRPGRATAAQPHRARADALQGAVGHELRFGRVHHRARQGAGGRRLAGLRQAQGRRAPPATSCAAAASAPISKSRGRLPRSMAASASRPTARSPC